MKRACGNCEYFEQVFSKYKLGEKINVCKMKGSPYNKYSPPARTWCSLYQPKSKGKK
jgi:hypothetical protein